MRSVRIITKIGQQTCVSTITAMPQHKPGHWPVGAGMSVVTQIDGVPDGISDADILAAFEHTCFYWLTDRNVYNYNDLGVGRVVFNKTPHTNNGMGRLAVSAANNRDLLQSAPLG